VTPPLTNTAPSTALNSFPTFVIFKSKTYLPGLILTVCDAFNEMEIIPYSGLVIVDAKDTDVVEP